MNYLKSTQESHRSFNMMPLQNTVLVTGATGFLGKVVLEELFRLRANYSVSKVILLIRPSGNQTASERFARVKQSQCFDNLHRDWAEGVEVVEGDLALRSCDMGEEVYNRLRKTVTHIIHTAGCIKFDSEVADAVSSNIDSSLHVLALAKDCDNLQQLVMTSTAYVTPPQKGPIYERLVELPRSASTIIAALRSGVLSKAQAIELTGHPNIYSLSKCLGEHIVCQSRGCLPLTIVRPSIICAALDYPRPGWIDSKAAFAGLVLGFGSGVLKVINGHRTTRMDVVPVDKVAACLLEETFRFDERGFERPQARIVFSVATTEQSLTLGESCTMLEAFFQKGAFQYIGPKGFAFGVQHFFHHYLRLQLAGVACRVRGDKSKELAIKKARRLVRGMNVVFGPYTNNTHDFRPTQPTVEFDPKQYLRIVCQGVYENLMYAKL